MVYWRYPNSSYVDRFLGVWDHSYDDQGNGPDGYWRVQFRSSDTYKPPGQSRTYWNRFVVNDLFYVWVAKYGNTWYTWIWDWYDGGSWIQVFDQAHGEDFVDTQGWVMYETHHWTTDGASSPCPNVSGTYPIIQADYLKRWDNVNGSVDLQATVNSTMYGSDDTLPCSRLQMDFLNSYPNYSGWKMT